MTDAPVLSPDTTVTTPDGIAAGIVLKQLDFALTALGQHTLRRNIHNYNGSLLAYTHQANMANQLGLSDEQKRAIAPFPDARAQNVSAVTTVVNPPPEAATLEAAPPVVKQETPSVVEAVKKPAVSLFRRLMPWAIAAALGTTTGGIASVALNYFWPDAPAVQVPSDPRHGEIGLEVE